MTAGECAHTATTAVEDLEAVYSRDENDEFVKATCIVPEGKSPAVMSDGDAVVFMNFRTDRARQLSRVFAADAFNGFTCKQRPAPAGFVMLTRYAESIPAPCAFPPATLLNTMGEYMASWAKPYCVLQRPRGMLTSPFSSVVANCRILIRPCCLWWN